MNDDIRVTLRRKGFVRQPDGSYSKADLVASGLPAAQPQPNVPPALDEGAGGEAGMLARARVCIVRRSCGPGLDRDNLYGCVKPVLDGLQAAGLIAGDSEREIELEVTQERVKTRREQGTQITIFELEPLKK